MVRDISQTDSPQAIAAATDLLAVFRPGTDQPFSQKVQDILDLVGPQGLTEAQVNTLIAAALAAYRTSAAEDGINSGKLDIDLQNVDTLSTVEANFFRNRLHALATDLGNVAQLSQAQRGAFRGAISAAIAPYVFTDSTSTSLTSVQPGEFVYLSDIDKFFVSDNGAPIQIRLIPTSDNFHQVHLPRVTGAEIAAGTGNEPRSTAPADIVGFINAHAPQGSSGLTQDQVDARVTTLRPNAFSDQDEAKLDGIEPSADVNRTVEQLQHIVGAMAGDNLIYDDAAGEINAAGGMGGTGITADQARALIADWAESGDSSQIPLPKLAALGLLIESFALISNASARIPAEKGVAGTVYDASVSNNVLSLDRLGTTPREVDLPGGRSDEELQDLVGAMAGANLTYDDAAGEINAAGIAGASDTQFFGKFIYPPSDPDKLVFEITHTLANGAITAHSINGFLTATGGSSLNILNAYDFKSDLNLDGDDNIYVAGAADPPLPAITLVNDLPGALVADKIYGLRVNSLHNAATTFYVLREGVETEMRMRAARLDANTTGYSRLGAAWPRGGSILPSPPETMVVLAYRDNELHIILNERTNDELASNIALFVGIREEGELVADEEVISCQIDPNDETHFFTNTSVPNPFEVGKRYDIRIRRSESIERAVLSSGDHATQIIEEDRLDGEIGDLEAQIHEVRNAGGGEFSDEEIGTVTLANDDTWYNITLSDEIVPNQQLEFRIRGGSVDNAYGVGYLNTNYLLSRPARTNSPTQLGESDAIGLKIARPSTDAQLDDFGHGTLFVGKRVGSDTSISQIRVLISHDANPDLTLSVRMYPLGSGPKGDTGADGRDGTDGATGPAGPSFVIHDLSHASSLSASDRIPISDEGTSGDPNRYRTAAEVRTFMQSDLLIASINGLQAALDAAGGDVHSSAMERDIADPGSGYTEYGTILTDLIPPDDAKIIMIQFRHGSSGAWTAFSAIDGVIWRGFTAYSAGTAMAVAQRMTVLNPHQGSYPWAIGQGAGGAIAVAMEDRGAHNRRFDKICVRWVTGS